jgi:hypothetical protein
MLVGGGMNSGRADLPVGLDARQRVPAVNNYEQNTF